MKMGNEDLGVICQEADGPSNIANDKFPFNDIIEQKLQSGTDGLESRTTIINNCEPGTSSAAFNKISKRCDNESQDIVEQKIPHENASLDNAENKCLDNIVAHDKESQNVADEDKPHDNPEKRSSRKRKLAMTSGSGLLCTVQYCGVSFPDPASLDLHHQGHLSQEIERVDRVRVKKSSLNLPDRKRLRKNRSETYQRLRGKREARHALPLIQRSSTSQQSGASNNCPVCEMSVEGSLEELNDHVEACLRVDRDPPEEDVVDVESEDYEEYEWAGQRRVRATSLFRGGLRGAGFLTIQRTGEDEELDVTGDLEEEEVGPAQYTDIDMVVMSADTAQGEVERRQLREAVMGKEEEEGEDREEEDEKVVNESPGEPPSEELESEVSRLSIENRKLKESSLCKICMDGYSRPLTSTVCWHVHCEQCWLLALGAKKLCPQCKVIVRPEDLRKIFL